MIVTIFPSFTSAVILVTVTARFAIVVVATVLFTLFGSFQLLLQHAIRDLLVMYGLEICSERVKGLTLMTLPNSTYLVEAVVAHVEPLHLEMWSRIGNVACWKELRDAYHLV